MILYSNKKYIVEIRDVKTWLYKQFDIYVFNVKLLNHE
jgi:hypothetical protein